MQREGGWKSMKPTKRIGLQKCDELFEELKMEKIREDYYLDLMAEWVSVMSKMAELDRQRGI